AFTSTTLPAWFLAPPSTSYTRVSATNAAAAATSAAVSAMTNPPTPPLAATNLTAAAADPHHVTLSWTDNSNPPKVEEDGFGMYRSIDGVNFVWKQSTGRDVTTYTDPDTLAPGTTYYYQMVAFNVDGLA